MCYNKNMKRFKSSSKNNSSKKNFTIKNDKNSDVVFERSKYFKQYDTKMIFKIIDNPKKPILQMEVKER